MNFLCDISFTVHLSLICPSNIVYKHPLDQRDNVYGMKQDIDVEEVLEHTLMDEPGNLENSH